MGKYVHAGVGISKADDPFQAGKEAVEMALKNMKKDGGKRPTFGLLFCSGGKYGKDDKTIKKLVDGAHFVFKDTPWIGCTTAGEISNYGLTQESCVVLAVDSDYIRIGVGIGNKMSENPRKAGSEGVKQALKKIKLDRYVDPYINYLRLKKMTPETIVKTKTKTSTRSLASPRFIITRLVAY